jgi:hypothetical protein
MHWHLVAGKGDELGPKRGVDVVERCVAKVLRGGGERHEVV